MAGKICFLCLLVASLVLIPSCGHPTQLVSVTIQPSGATIFGIGTNATVQFTAQGQFIHPTETRDVTTQVTWTSDVPDVASINSSGLATAGAACGISNITATAGNNIGVPFSSQAITTATAQFTVADAAIPSCPQH